MAYIDKYGAKFNDDKTILVKVPIDYCGIYEIPNGTISVQYDAFKGCSHLTAIVIPETIEEVFDIDNESFDFLNSCKKLECFIVDSRNKNYFAIDGILYFKNDEEKFVVAFPPAKCDWFYLPNDVKLCSHDNTDIYGYVLHCTPRVLEFLIIDESNAHYVLKDGALYNKNMDHLIALSKEVKEYYMPDSVITGNDSAFLGCNKLRKISIGSSFEDLINYGCLSAVLSEDCSSLESINVPQYNEKYYAIDGVLFANEYGVRKLIFAPRRIRKSIYTIAVNVASEAFLGCKNIKSFKIEYPVRIGRDAFVDTAFYNNKENWDDNFLYIDDYLIKVSEDYNLSTLIIPSTSHVITDDSITSSNISAIEISEGVINFNSGSISCPNLKTLKLPSSLSSRYLTENQIEFNTWCNNNAPKLEKILIPQGTRDFYLPHINSHNHKLLFEYDYIGNETPIKKLTSDEEVFYSSIHEYSGFPNYIQYTIVKRCLLNEEAVSEEQILSLLPAIDKFELQYCFAKVKYYLEKEGYVVRHIWYKPQGEKNRISLYYMELDNKIEELDNILKENHVLRAVDFRTIFGVGWDHEWSKYTRLRNYYFKCIDK